MYTKIHIYEKVILTRNDKRLLIQAANYLLDNPEVNIANIESPKKRGTLTRKSFGVFDAVMRVRGKNERGKLELRYWKFEVTFT